MISFISYFKYYLYAYDSRIFISSLGHSSEHQAQTSHTTRLIHPTAYSTAPLRCLTGTPNSICLHLNFWYTPHPVHPIVFTITVSGNSILPAAQAKNLSIVLDRGAVLHNSRGYQSHFSQCYPCCAIWWACFPWFLSHPTSDLLVNPVGSTFKLYQKSTNFSPTPLFLSWPQPVLLQFTFHKNNQNNPLKI